MTCPTCKGTGLVKYRPVPAWDKDSWAHATCSQCLGRKTVHDTRTQLLEDAAQVKQWPDWMQVLRTWNTDPKKETPMSTLTPQAELVELRAARDLTESALRHVLQLPSLFGSHPLPDQTLRQALDRLNTMIDAQERVVSQGQKPEHSLTLEDVEFLWDLALRHIQFMLQYQPGNGTLANHNLKKLLGRMPAGWRKDPV